MELSPGRFRYQQELLILDMIQQIIVVLVFIAAIVYIGRLILRSFQAKADCASGCGKCGVDFKKLENELQKKGI